MRLEIVGVGQTFNFETSEMEDSIMVRSPSGETVAIPTTNEAAQRLVEMATKNGNGFAPRVQPAVYEEEPEPLPTPRREVIQDVPDGAEVFGGDVETEEPRLFRQVQQTTLDRRHNAPDGSGVPSYGLARVDERGNPIIPQGIISSVEEEEIDPGEQM